VSKTLREVNVGPELDEHEVWEDFALPALRDLSENVQSICEYGFTEMLNNVIDHSGSPAALLSIDRQPSKVTLLVHDRGIGIFRKVQQALGLENEHAAVLELTKGRFTTDPERHTGEGIFFTCRMFDYFSVVSGTVSLHFRTGEQDWWMEDTEPKEGSTVWMEIAPDSKRTTKGVFDRFAGEEAGFELNSTVLSIRLLQQSGGGLVSRSQARRLLARMQQFRTVVLDFEGVSGIGPAFADEIFRVFARNHPATVLVPVNASVDVARMIARAIGRANGATPTA
jgi:anti-sigma regulatory factor (Ser/Thr protein kinase)